MGLSLASSSENKQCVDNAPMADPPLLYRVNVSADGRHPPALVQVNHNEVPSFLERTNLCLCCA